MSSILSQYINGCIGGVVALLIEPIIEPLDFFVSSTKYVKDMKDAMASLDVIKQGIQYKKNLADANHLVVPDNVEPWLEDFEKLSERSNLIETITPFNVEKRYKAGKESSEILKEIKLLEAQKNNIQFTTEPKPRPKVASTSAHGYRFESRVPIFDALFESLQSNNETQKMIALCGMGGLGKTTMIEQLNHVVQNENMFYKVVKVEIGQTVDPIALQQIFAECLTGNDLTKRYESNRAQHLRQEFLNMSENEKNKVLVIMDNIWEDFDLKNVGLSPIPNGFKLLLVSRDGSVCTRMGVQPDLVFNITFLDNKESEALFFGIVRPSPSNGDDNALTDIGKHIVRKCGGLPIAIETIARNLSGGIEDEWHIVSKRLDADNLQDINSSTHKIFEMSYEKFLKDDEKAIFLLCGLFPGGFNIPIEDLMMYGWGLKLFTEVQTLEDARREANSCTHNLIRANLLTKSDRIGCVKMHDLVRAFILNNFSKVKQASIVNHNNMSSEQLAKNPYERVLLKCAGMSGLPADINYTNLSLLVLMDGYELSKFPEDMDKIMKKLEVVSYENMGIPVLPKTFEHSTTLRTLRLCSCSLTGDISSLGSLCNLETLSLVHCNIRWLPSAIGELKKLKLLDLTGCVDLYIDQGVLQDLKDNLEELYMRASKGSPVKFTPEKCVL